MSLRQMTDIILRLEWHDGEEARVKMSFEI